jgi:hypothetical protein
VQEIFYQPYEVAYRTFDGDGTQKLRLTFEPVQILAGGRKLPRQQELQDVPGWVFDPALRVLTIKPEAREVTVLGR